MGGQRPPALVHLKILIMMTSQQNSAILGVPSNVVDGIKSFE